MNSKRSTITHQNFPADFSPNPFSPLRKQEKISDQYLSCPKSYLLLSIPKTPEYKNIESKLQSIHKSSIKTRQSEIRVKNLSTSK